METKGPDDPGAGRPPLAFELPARRRIERRDLITLFSELPPGGQISAAEVEVFVGLDVTSSSADRNLAYQVREHCRDVLGFIVEYDGGTFKRLNDADIAGDRGVLYRRRERIMRQARRGLSETEAINDWKSLPREDKIRVLSHMSIFGVIAVCSHREAPARLTDRVNPRHAAPLDPALVLAAVGAIRQ